MQTDIISGAALRTHVGAELHHVKHVRNIRNNAPCNLERTRAGVMHEWHRLWRHASQ